MRCNQSSFLYMLLALFVFLAGPPGIFAEDGVSNLPEAFSAGNRAGPSEKPYWELLGDPTLSELISRGLEGNFDVEAARYRILQAEAAARQMRAPLLPSVSAEAGYNMTPYNNLGPGLDLGPMAQGFPMATGVGDTKVRHTVSAVVKASYLVDIVGKNTAARKGALKDVDAAKADVDSLAANLTFLITQAYFDVVAAQRRLELLGVQVKTNEELLELVETRLDLGSANAIDVLQQRQQLERAKSNVPIVQSSIETYKQQLAVLLGMGSPATLPQISSSLPKFRGEPLIGKPSGLISSRPDIRAESERVFAAKEREKNAFRTLFPSLVLTGQAGYQGNYIDKYDDGEIWGFGAVLSIPLYEGGRNFAALDLARAQVASAESARHQATLNALLDVESSLSRYRASLEFHETLLRQLDASKLAFEEARKRYAVGLIDYLNVLVILASHQQLELSEVQAREDVVMNRARLLKSLGGKWTKNIARKKAE